jgi:hypothetical protein
MRWSWSCWMIMSHTMVFPDVVPPKTPWKKSSSNSQSEPPEWEATGKKGERHGRKLSGSTAHRSLLLLKALGSKSIDLLVEPSTVVLGENALMLYPLRSRKNRCNASRCGRLPLPEKESQLQVYRRRWVASSTVNERTWCSCCFFPVAPPEEVKEHDWEATGNSLVTRRGGEGEHAGRRL